MKDTPFGKIPDGWGLDTINNVCDVVTDYVANGSFKSLAENVEYQEHEDSTILIRLVDYNNGFNSDFVYVNDHAYEFLAKSKLFGGEVIISNVGANVGTVFRCPYLNKQMTLGPNSVMLKFKQNDDFYYYWLKSPAGQHMLQSIVTGSAQPKFNKTNLRQVVVPVPDESTQNKIASFLITIDKQIDVNNKINRNLEQQLHILFIQIFNSINADVILGDVVETTSGGTPSRKHTEYYENGSICWVKSKELLGNYILDTEEHINDMALSKSSAKLLPRHSVLIAMYGATVGAHGIISKSMTCNQAVCALLCNEKYPYTYLFQIAQEQQQKLINMAVGSAQQNISQILIKQLPLHSDISAIRKFHDLAFPLHKQIEELQAENRILSEMRDTLLPQLMSGRLDVSDIDL